MKLLENRILNDGNVLGEDILKVDSFLTHQVDYELLRLLLSKHQVLPQLSTQRKR